MQESTVTVKGQTTLPRDVRVALGLSPGDKLRYLVLDGGEVRIMRSRPVRELAGQGTGCSATLTFDRKGAVVPGMQLLATADH